MDIREFLELRSSRLNADILADKIEEDPEVFDLVWNIMLEDTHPVSMRAAWTLSIFSKRHPYFIEPRTLSIIDCLSKVKSSSVKRCLLNMLTIVPVPSDQSGFLFDFCFEVIESVKSDIAHKAYAMTILYNISELEPDLKPELVALFESQMDDESAGISARSRILINQLYKDMGLPEK
ncbi:hypothetical protein ACFLSP_00680 [Bacteroidota bacterium]